MQSRHLVIDTLTLEAQGEVLIVLSRSGIAFGEAQHIPTDTGFHGVISVGPISESLLNELRAIPDVISVAEGDNHEAEGSHATQLHDAG